MKKMLRRGVTMLELLVVLVVVSILSTIAVGVYTKEVLRAKYARARSEIRTLEVAIAQYEVATGQMPPSGTGSTIAPAGVVSTGTVEGSGYLQMALRSSLNGDPHAPLSARWTGPYVDWDYNRLGLLDGTPITEVSTSISQGQVSFLDPFGFPYTYIRYDDYDTRGGTELPSSNVFFAQETWYNPSTYQIFSVGPNGQTLAIPNRGTEADDITNFLSPNI